MNISLALGAASAIAVGSIAQAPTDRARLSDESTALEVVLTPIDGGDTAGEVRALESLSSVQVQEVRVVFDSPAESITVGVPITESADLTSLNSQVRATLVDMADDLVQSPSPSGSLEAAVDSATADARDGVAFTEMTVSLAENAEVPAGYVAEEPPSGAPPTFELMADSDCGTTWWPDYAIVHTGASEYAGMRFGTVRFAWTTNSRLTNLKCFNNGSPTFEPDLKTSNRNNTHYFMKTVESWSSNMPNDYLDTQLFDGNGVYIFTVGTSRANNLDPDHEYRTYFRAKNGNVSVDDGSLELQHGYRQPNSCDSTLCIFSSGTSKPYIPTWDVPIPGLITETK